MQGLLQKDSEPSEAMPGREAASEATRARRAGARRRCVDARPGRPRTPRDRQLARTRFDVPRPVPASQGVSGTQSPVQPAGQQGGPVRVPKLPAQVQG